MKKWILISLGAAALMFAACSKKDDSGGGEAPAGYATTPQPCNLGQAGCDPNAYAQYQNYYQLQASQSWNYGAWYWPQNANISISNCGCPVGTAPVVYQNSIYGDSVSCAPSNMFATFRVQYWGGVYNTGGLYANGNVYSGFQNTQSLNIPQYPYAGGANSCLQQAGRGCDTRLNNCSAGSVCQPAAGGTGFGICRTL